MRQMKEIATVLESRDYTLVNIICDTMKKFNFKTLCHQSGIRKAEGYSATEIITLLIMLPLMTLKNVHQLYKSEYGKKAAMQKDALHRLKNNERYSWRSLLYILSQTNLELLREYWLKCNPREYLFPGITGKQLTVRGFQAIFDKQVTKAGITKNVTTHSLRHSYVKHATQNSELSEAPCRNYRGLRIIRLN